MNSKRIFEQILTYAQQLSLEDPSRRPFNPELIPDVNRPCLPPGEAFARPQPKCTRVESNAFIQTPGETLGVGYHPAKTVDAGRKNGAENRVCGAAVGNDVRGYLNVSFRRDCGREKRATERWRRAGTL